MKVYSLQVYRGLGIEVGMLQSDGDTVKEDEHQHHVVEQPVLDHSLTSLPKPGEGEETRGEIRHTEQPRGRRKKASGSVTTRTHRPTHLFSGEKMYSAQSS